MLKEQEIPERAPLSVATTSLVAFGGGIGASARYLLGLWFPSAGLPWVILAINVAGSFALGWLMGAVVERRPATPLRPFIGIGVLGGFTTFSALCVETVRLARAGHMPSAVLYVVLSVGLGYAAAAGGERLGGRAA